MIGAILSLCAALFWACAVILFKKSGEVFSPVSLNIYNSVVTIILMSMTMVVLDIPFFPDKPASDWWTLAFSGLLGITLADLFFFMSLNRLGAGLTAIVECLYLPCVIFFSILLLGEKLSTGAIIGAVLILAAVFIGSAAGRVRRTDIDGNPATLPGILLGCLAMISLAAGIVIIKELLEHTDIFWATLVRVWAAILSLFVILLCHPKRRQYLRELKFSKAWINVFPAAFLGNYLALICWVAGMKYTTASRAAILNQMSTIFIFILAALFLKEKITRNKCIAIALALTGAFLTILN